MSHRMYNNYVISSTTKSLETKHRIMLWQQHDLVDLKIDKRYLSCQPN